MYGNDRPGLSLRLEETLHSRHMTQKELAKRAGITEASISHYIKGDRTPRSYVLARIAEVLGTTSEYLMEGMPQSYQDEIRYAMKLIVRNADKLTLADKRELVLILLSD